MLISYWVNGPGYYEPGDTLPSAVQVELSDYIDPIRAKVESLVTFGRYRDGGTGAI